MQQVLRIQQIYKTLVSGKFKTLFAVILLVALVSISGIFIFGVFTTRAYEVNIDNKYICVVKTKEIVQEILNDIKTEAEKRYGAEIIISNEISFDSVLLANKKIINENEIRNNLQKYASLTAKAFAIYVEGNAIAFLKDKTTAEEILNTVKAPYLEDGEDHADIGFVEDVGIVEKEIPVDNLKEPEEVIKSIFLQEDQIKTYTVKKGDTISEIAEELGLKVADIKKANPEINIDKISIGQQINLMVPRYTINVKKITYTTYEENIPFEQKSENSGDLYRGESKVKVKGVQGRKLVKADIVSINGIVEATNIIDEEVIEAPKTEIVLRGTKERPRTLAYGEFIIPSRGSISSRFGERWSSQHTGVDIAVPRGTPNKAADGGLVTFAGWSGGYGKLVIIDHENGYTTYYAHNDTITVKKGQRVARGDTIGTAGSTGNATGPHLHFEVRKNGIPVNPLNYIK